MKTIAIINQKGGVGKSTTAHALGAGLSLQGNRVLFVDLDAQGNLSYTLGADTAGYNAYGVLQRPETIEEELQNGNILASSPSLAIADAAVTEVGKEYRLKKALALVANKFDYCIIDTPPALGIVSVNALTACNYAIIPAQADIYSLQGINQLYSTINAVKEYCNPSLEVLGIVLTRYSARGVLSREVAEMLEEKAAQLNTRLYKTKIRECIALKEAQTAKQSIFEYAPKSNASADYEALLREIDL